MFDNKDQRKDWLELMEAMDTLPNPPACENFPDAYFPERAERNGDHYIRLAVDTCRRCPVVAQCAAYAIKWEAEGIWGATTANDRKRIRRARRLPDPVSEIEEIEIEAA